MQQPFDGPASKQIIEVELPRTPEDLKEALEWLKEPKVLALKERNSERQFSFTLYEAEGDFQFVWAATNNPSSTEGFVLLSDIEDIKAAPSDPTLFTLVLKKNKPQAVRNSGGLHIVVVRARSPPECAMYRSGLLGLMQAAYGLEAVSKGAAIHSSHGLPLCFY